jgi:hypothetical protein
VSKVTINGNTYNLPAAGTPAGWGEDTTNIILDLIEVVNSLSGTGSISESAANLANNQSSAISVPGLLFSNAINISVSVSYVIDVNATTKIVETGMLSLRYDKQNSQWTMARDYTGDDSKVGLSIDSTGQVLYTTPSYPGFVSCVFKFKTGQSVIGA